MGIRNIVDNREPWFVKKINAYLMEGAVKKPAVGRFRPSDFVELPTETCYRQLQYVYMGYAVSSEFGLEVIKRMMAGTAHHSMWEEVFREAIPSTEPGKLIEIRGDEVYQMQHVEGKDPIIIPIRTDVGANYPYIRMMCDWCVTKSSDDAKELIEWKTGRWTKPAKKHIVQWNIYATALGIEKGWIAIENREEVNPVYYAMKRDNELVNVLFTGLRNIESASKRKEMLCKDERCSNGVWKPKQCEYYELCFSEKGDCPWS